MRPTVVFQGRTVGPDEFEANWRRSAAALQAQGIGDRDVVALMTRNSPEALELIVAVRHLGAQWCPVNWHFKSDEVAYILGNSGAKLFIADADLLDALTDLQPGAARTYSLRGTHPGTPAWEALRDGCEPITTPAAPPRGAMFYTSGTTGRPKGIVRNAMTPAQVQASLELRQLAYGIEPGMRALVNAPMYHSAPNSYALGIAQVDGTLYMEARFDAERTLQLIDQHRLTHAYLVPTMYVRMLALPAEVRAKYDLSSMTMVASTGSPCPPDVKRAMIEWWGPVINECYGSSELGYMTLLTSEQALRKPGSAGQKLAGVMIAPPNTLRTDDQIVGYYAQAVQAIGADVPFVIQDYPLTFSVQMTPAVIRRIATELPSCAMLKHEDWPGLEKISTLRRWEREGSLRHLPILVGNNGLFLDYEMERGADGANTGYAFPDLLVDVVRLSGEGRREEAHDLFDAHLPLLRYEQQPGVGLSVRKYILHRRGLLASAALRAPASPLTATAVAEVEHLLGRLAKHDPRARL